MSKWDIITLDRRSEWEAALASFDHDVYHRWDYHRLAFENGEGDPVLITWGTGPQSAAMPLLLRPIPEAPERIDATSVYGYPGPLCRGPADDGEPLGEALEELGLVCAFSRLNPLLDTSHALGGIGSITTLGPTVSLDLSVEAGERFAAYSRSARRRIQQLKKSGAEVFVDEDLIHLGDFGSIYAAAMRRVGAAERYDFDVEHHRRLLDLLGDCATLIVCRLGDDVLAAGLYLSNGDRVQAHLAADNPQYRHLAPQRLEIHAAADIFAQRGFSRLHLGGGVGSGEDSLLAFKRGFGGDETRFTIWSHIVDADAYQSLNAATQTGAAECAHFPAYRRPGSALGSQVGST
ncbi:MAG: GNAT family N-acetyltransferase [Acidobacteria bacterium]|nr:GNAT family N-acetyltransferase [Acidobacteriota bacterium]